MWFLLGTTLTTSFFDSLNPSAIAQQLLLQATVKNKRHIWFFILGIGLANYVMGLTIYYGIAAWVSRLIAKIAAAYPLPVYGAAMAAGTILFAVGVRLIIKTRKSGAATTEEVKAPARLSPLSLFVMGAVFCLVELTSALPYFGFLALMTTYNPALPLVLIFVLIYDFMYTLPLILLYFSYNKLQGTAVIEKLESVLGRVSAYIVPVALSLAGVLLVYYGATSI